MALGVNAMRSMNLRRMSCGLALAVACAAPAAAQTLTLMKSIDSPHYDGHRTTWTPTANKKLKGVRAHMLYGNAFYKGLDISL
jgi:hypothetical protein